MVSEYFLAQSTFNKRLWFVVAHTVPQLYTFLSCGTYYKQVTAFCCYMWVSQSQLLTQTWTQINKATTVNRLLRDKRAKFINTSWLPWNYIYIQQVHSNMANGLTMRLYKFTRLCMRNTSSTTPWLVQPPLSEIILSQLLETDLQCSTTTSN